MRGLLAFASCLVLYVSACSSVVSDGATAAIGPATESAVVEYIPDMAAVDEAIDSANDGFRTVLSLGSDASTAEAADTFAAAAMQFRAAADTLEAGITGVPATVTDAVREALLRLGDGEQDLADCLEGAQAFDDCDKAADVARERAGDVGSSMKLFVLFGSRTADEVAATIN